MRRGTGSEGGLPSGLYKKKSPWLILLFLPCWYLFSVAGVAGAHQSALGEKTWLGCQPLAAVATSAKRRPSWVDIDSSPPVAEENAKSSSRRRAQKSDTAKRSQPAKTDPANEQRSSASTDDGTLIMDLFKEHSHALDILERRVLDKLAQNTSDSGRALREKSPAERRSQIKLARPPLIKQKDAFADAKAAYRWYCQLQAVIQRVSQSVRLAAAVDPAVYTFPSKLLTPLF